MLNNEFLVFAIMNLADKHQVLRQDLGKGSCHTLTYQAYFLTFQECICIIGCIFIAKKEYVNYNKIVKENKEECN